MIRAFLSVEPCEDLTRQLASVQEDLKRRLARDPMKAVRISWVRISSIHLTIKFLGDIEVSLVEPLREALDAAVRGHQSLQIPLERLGAFPRPQQPRVLWVGPSAQWEHGEDAKRLAALHRAVEECCESFGCTREGRPLSPHLTLARVKEGDRHLGQVLAKSGVMDRPLSIGALTVEPIALMKSELQPAGPAYTKLWEVEVGRRG